MLKDTEGGDNYSTNVITALKNDGSATFGATVKVTHGAGGVENLSMNNSPSGGVFYVRDSNGSTKITLNGYDYSAAFAGEIKVEGSSTPSGRSSRISKYGSLLIATTSDAVGDARLAIDSGNGNITSIGSATFQNTVLANRTGATQTAFQATLSGVTKVNIAITSSNNIGGAANFASHLITGSANSVTSTSAHGSYIGEGIVVNAIQPNATPAAQERVWW